MAVRNSQELGENLQNIAMRLLSNQNLCKLLIYSDRDPLSREDIENTMELLEKNITVIPLVNEKEFDTESKIVLVYDSGLLNEDNTEFKTVLLSVLVYTPLRSWVINDLQLRPFYIISEIEKSLKGKKINGLGKLTYNGFTLDLLTDDISCYKLEFEIDAYDW